jgi:hypothetical protein
MRCALGVVAALCFGCASNEAAYDPNAEANRPSQRLAADLESLADAPDESQHLAQAANEHSYALAAEYRISRPPLFHNVLVNVGLKDRGLCWHWTEDLLAHLRDLGLEHYDFYWATAYRGQLFREHNSVIVTAKGSALETGLVLDPWRHSGELYWVSVREDSYPWEPH